MQGLTLAATVGRSGPAPVPERPTVREEADARDSLNRAGLEHVEHLATLEALPETALERARRGLSARLERSNEGPEGAPRTPPTAAPP